MTISNRGFTLLEVLLALALLAISGMAALSLSGETLRNTPIIEQRILAQIVADNQMMDIHLRQKWPTLNWQRTEHELAGQRWVVRYRSVKTSSNDFRAIDVEVRLGSNEASPAIASLRSYMADQG